MDLTQINFSLPEHLPPIDYDEQSCLNITCLHEHTWSDWFAKSIIKTRLQMGVYQTIKSQGNPESLIIAFIFPFSISLN